MSKADDTTLLQLNGTVPRTLQKMKSGVQASIDITKYAGNYAQGTVYYSDQSPTQQFIAVKSDDTWKIIAHNTGNRLNLPDVKMAKQYRLSKDWYREN